MLYDATDPDATRSAEAFGRARSDAGGLQWSVQTEEGRWERAPSSAEGAPPAAAATEVPEADEPATDDAAVSQSGDDGPPRREPASVERTLSIIKPDATQANVTGSIVARLEESGLRVVAQRRLRLTRAAAEGFYAEHQERPFFQSLCDFMTSGPVVVQVLEGEDAIMRNRQVMGATDPGDADPGTLRKDFGSSIEQNAIHGSDSPASAAREIAYFFSALDIVG
ncbi:MAG: nucleoside-diphosphate kinase [Rhodospirillales bacterium]|nr:nucleoside-diphosphate kinase [Rhodospirillales bacterium]